MTTKKPVITKKSAAAKTSGKVKAAVSVKAPKKVDKKPAPAKAVLPKKAEPRKARAKVATKNPKASTGLNEKPGMKINCTLPGADLLEQGKSVEEVMAALEKEKQKHPGGRPAKFDKPEEMQAVIDDYFESCFQIVEIKKGEGENQIIETKRIQIEPYTVAGLALALGMTTQALRDYEKKDEFLCLIKEAKQKVEVFAESRLFGCNSTGAIFWLKNHAGYVDRQIQEHDVSPTLAAELKAARERANI